MPGEIDPEIASQRVKRILAYWLSPTPGQQAMRQAVRAKLGDEEIERILAEDDALTVTSSGSADATEQLTEAKQAVAPRGKAR